MENITLVKVGEGLGKVSCTLNTEARVVTELHTAFIQVEGTTIGSWASQSPPRHTVFRFHNKERNMGVVRFHAVE
jgi:hypothetical protein